MSITVGFNLLMCVLVFFVYIYFLYLTSSGFEEIIIIDNVKEHKIKTKEMTIVFSDNKKVVLNCVNDTWEANGEKIEIGKEIRIQEHSLLIEKRKTHSTFKFWLGIVIAILSSLSILAVFSLSIDNSDNTIDKATIIDPKNITPNGKINIESDSSDKDSFQNSIVNKKNNLLKSSISAGVQYIVGIENDLKPIIAWDGNMFDFSGWENIVSIAGNEEVIIGLDKSGKVFTTCIPNSESEKIIDVSDWENIIQIGAGDRYVVGLDENGCVYFSGRNVEGQLNINDWEKIRQIVVSHRLTVGLDERGMLRIAGYESENLIDQYTNNKSEWKDIVQISAGGGLPNHDAWGHIVGLDSSGKVHAIGDNKYGQCDVRDWDNVIKVAAGNSHTVGLTSDGRILVAGNPGTINKYPGQNEKERIENWNDKGIIDIDAGNNLTVAVTSSGEVYAAGYEDHNQMSANDWNNIYVER